MEKQYKVNLVVSVILIALAFLSNAICLFSEMNIQFSYIFVHLVNIIALVCACIYLLSGANKEAAIWLKLFELFLACAYLAAVIRYYTLQHSPIVLLLTVIAYGFVTSLFNTVNIGKERSLTICGILIAIEIITMVMGIAVHQFSNARYVSTGSRIIMVVVLYMLMNDKYYDKSLRGAK